MLPKDKNAFFVHIRRLAALNGGEDAVFAAWVVRSTLALILESGFPGLVGAGLVSGSSKLKYRPALQGFATWLQGAPLLETAFWLSSAYAHLMPAEQRGQQALFFTPPTLSTRLIGSLRRHGVRLTKARFADPSCGGSAFLVPVAVEIVRELALAGWDSYRILAHIENHVSGFELDPVLCDLSRAFLNIALYDHVCRAGKLLEPTIVEGDALTTALPYSEAFDVVISNPPYRKLDAREFDKLDGGYRHLVNGQPNLYALFIDLSLRLTKAEGHLGFLTPAGFFGGRSFDPLRRVLRRDSTVIQVDFIEPRVGAFLDVEQETALTVLHKRPEKASAVSVFVTTDGKEFTPLGTHALAADTSASWVLPRSPDELGALQAFSEARWHLEDYGYAPRTGFLVPHRMPVPRLSRRGNRLWVCPLIWATQIGKDGIHHFRPGRGDHADIFVDVSGYGWDHVITTPSVALQRTSSKDQSRRIRCAPIGQRFIEEHGGYMGENHVCFIVPIPGREVFVSVDVLADILNSAAVNSVFRCLSGTATVSAYELRAMPMPDPDVVKSELANGAGRDAATAKGYLAAHRAARGRNKKAA